MAQFSFDCVSDYDKAEMNNVFDQVQREISSRYDFKGTSASIEWLAAKNGLKITGDNQFQLDKAQNRKSPTKLGTSLLCRA
jgi:uncharacterized protein YajQ (UPF0234 family)